MRQVTPASQRMQPDAKAKEPVVNSIWASRAPTPASIWPVASASCWRAKCQALASLAHVDAAMVKRKSQMPGIVFTAGTASPHWSSRLGYDEPSHCGHAGHHPGARAFEAGSIVWRADGDPGAPAEACHDKPHRACVTLHGSCHAWKYSDNGISTTPPGT